MNKYKILVSMWLLAIATLWTWGFDAAAQENRLVIWSHWAESPGKVKMMTLAAEGFQQEYGVAVEIVWMPKPELLEKLPFALDTAEPDITYIDGGFSHPRIVRSLLELSDLQFSGQREPSWTLGSVGAGRNNFLPIEGIAHGIYYHKKLFEQAGVALPQGRPLTFPEFLEIVRTLRVAGITPIGEGSADRTGKIGIPIINTIFRVAGPEKMQQLITGEINFSDPDVARALELWKQVVDLPGYDHQKALQLTLLGGIYEVVDGKAAMNFCGTYFYDKYGETEHDRGQIGVLDWFTVENGKGNGYYEMLWGAGYGINRNSQRLEHARKFLEYLMRPAAGSLWMKYVQSPYPVMPGEFQPDSLYKELMNQRKGQQPTLEAFTYTTFTSKAAMQMWEDVVRKFIVGDHSVELLIDRMNSRLR